MFKSTPVSPLAALAAHRRISVLCLPGQRSASAAPPACPHGLGSAGGKGDVENLQLC